MLVAMLALAGMAACSRMEETESCKQNPHRDKTELSFRNGIINKFIIVGRG